MYLESRRSFLKGAAFSVAAVGIAKGVFTTDAVAESVSNTKFTNTPDKLDFYPDVKEWGGHLILFYLYSVLGCVSGDRAGQHFLYLLLCLLSC